MDVEVGKGLLFLICSTLGAGTGIGEMTVVSCLCGNTLGAVAWEGDLTVVSIILCCTLGAVTGMNEGTVVFFMELSGFGSGVKVGCASC